MVVTRRSLLAAASVPLFAQRNAQPARPNILLILADDLPAWLVGCYGNKEIRTPHIDVLARGGTRFLNHFACTPACSSSRATLFTGRTPMQHGIHDFLTSEPIGNPPQGQAAPPTSFASEVMISDVLSQGGYSSAYVGKWHMGSDTKPSHGYSFSYTMTGGRAPYNDPQMSFNGETVKESGYLTDLMTRRALQFLDMQQKGKPFFLVTAYLNAHTPYDGHPQRYYDMYSKVDFDSFGYSPAASNALRDKEMLKDTLGNLRKCAASVTALDDQIPVLLGKLRQRDFVDNTLIIFASDNGNLLGRHGLWNSGLASDPINMYEEVVQVPMIWNWAGRIPVEAVRPEMVSLYDLAPSICEAAGVTVPNRNLCGRSYFPLATNKPLPRKEPWRSTVFGRYRDTEMARDNRFKLVLRNEGKAAGDLYDVRSDAREKANLYENPQYVTVRERLAGELAGWRKRYSS